MENVFDRKKHVYHNDDFSEMLKDAVRFFHGTPVFGIPPPESFSGSGVYALYYIGCKGLYSKFGKEINRTSYSVPIYVGKAVPPGWRQSRASGDRPQARSLFNRLVQHARGLNEVRNLRSHEFACRFMIFEGDVESMIPAVEAAVIALHTPLWNSVIDGFGNHDPGVKRKTGRLSAWDALHSGRSWASRIEGEIPKSAELKRRVTDYLVGLRCR